MKTYAVLMNILVVMLLFALMPVALPVEANSELPGGYATIRDWDQVYEAFSFSSGDVTSEGGDFFIADRGEDSIIHVFDSPGILDMGAVSLESITEAPESGYAETAPPIEGHSYAVRSLGKYGKFCIEDIKSAAEYDWITATEYEIEWVYQPDGTRSFGEGGTSTTQGDGDSPGNPPGAGGGLLEKVKSLMDSFITWIKSIFSSR